jgi:predicted lysophospholipase L1 biosynthesis ABC-type transport system permease subunit
LREVDESSRQLNSAIDRASRFLNLASLASVLLAAVAVAMGARRYATRHIDTVALMKCMGASQGFVLAISVIELTLLAVFAVAIGASLGYLAQRRTGVAAAGPHPHRLAACVTGAAAHCTGHRSRHAHRLRLAAAAAIEKHPAGTRAAQERERAAAALRLELPAGARSAVRNSLEPGA